MKNLAIILVAALQFVLFACSKDNEKPSYSDKQQKVLAVFHGTFADHQFSSLGNPLLGDPDIIVFGAQYQKPIELSSEDYMNKNKYMGEAHGECVYKKRLLKNEPYTELECYYNISYDGTALTLYRKTDKEFYKHYTLSVKSPTEFYLYDQAISLPYIFKKK